MPRIEYATTNLLEVLGVEPEVRDDGIVEVYHLIQGPVELQFAIRPYEGSVELLLYVSSRDMPLVRVSCHESVVAIAPVIDPRSPKHLTITSHTNTIDLFVEPQLRITVR